MISRFNLVACSATRSLYHPAKKSASFTQQFCNACTHFFLYNFYIREEFNWQEYNANLARWHLAPHCEAVPYYGRMHDTITTSRNDTIATSRPPHTVICTPNQFEDHPSEGSNISLPHSCIPPVVGWRHTRMQPPPPRVDAFHSVPRNGCASQVPAATWSTLHKTCHHSHARFVKVANLVQCCTAARGPGLQGRTVQG